MFKRILELEPHKQTLFAILVVTGVVAVWRGLWGLMDLYVIPHDMSLSFVVSILLGLAILGGTHYTVQELM